MAAEDVVVAVARHTLCKLELHYWKVDGSLFVCKYCQKKEDYSLESKRVLLGNSIDFED